LIPEAAPFNVTAMPNDVHGTTFERKVNPPLQSIGKAHRSLPQQKGVQEPNPEIATPPERVLLGKVHMQKDPLAETPHRKGAEKVLPAAASHSLQPTRTAKPQMGRRRRRAQPNQRNSMASVTDQAPAQDEPIIDVTVHIGRIEVQAKTNNRQAAQKKAPKTQTTMNLNDYIEQRTGGQR
jgi:hypothetical protein